MTNLQKIFAGIFIAGGQGGGALLLLLCALPFAVLLALPFVALIGLIRVLELIPALTKKGAQKPC